MPDSARLVGSRPALAAAEFGATAWTTAPRFTLSCLATASDEICMCALHVLMVAALAQIMCACRMTDLE